MYEAFLSIDLHNLEGRIRRKGARWRDLRLASIVGKFLVRGDLSEEAQNWLYQNISAHQVSGYYSSLNANDLLAQGTTQRWLLVVPKEQENFAARDSLSPPIVSQLINQIDDELSSNDSNILSELQNEPPSPEPVEVQAIDNRLLANNPDSSPEHLENWNAANAENEESAENAENNAETEDVGDAENAEHPQNPELPEYPDHINHPRPPDHPEPPEPHPEQHPEHPDNHPPDPEYPEEAPPQYDVDMEAFRALRLPNMRRAVGEILSTTNIRLLAGDSPLDWGIAVRRELENIEEQQRVLLNALAKIRIWAERNG